MMIIAHRINTCHALEKVAQCHGIEVDIRYHQDQIILAHDAFNHHHTQPTALIALLKRWQHDGPIILNLKTTGVENHCARLMQTYGITNWFFLDMIAPTFWWHTQRGNKALFHADHIALRCSEYEPVESVLHLRQQARWIWLDTFTGMVNPNTIVQLQSNGFMVCLVSPELQSYPSTQIIAIQQALGGIQPDAVCTKHPALWSKRQ